MIYQSQNNHQAHNNTKHVIHTEHINNYDSFQLYAMHLDTTPICMWYEINSEVVTPDANWTS